MEGGGGRVRLASEQSLGDPCGQGYLQKSLTQNCWKLLEKKGEKSYGLLKGHKAPWLIMFREISLNLSKWERGHVYSHVVMGRLVMFKSMTGHMPGKGPIRLCSRVIAALACESILLRWNLLMTHSLTHTVMKLPNDAVLRICPNH